MTAGARVTRREARAAFAWAVKELETLRSAAEAAGYRWDGLVGTLGDAAAPGPGTSPTA
jgi:hypothetical protein